MAEQISVYQLLGSRDLFPNETINSKEYYGNYIGKKLLQKMACHFLSLFKSVIPDNERFISDWFSRANQNAYEIIIDRYNQLAHDKYRYKILSVESLLQLFTWSLNANIPDDGKEDRQAEIYAFLLYLQFNDDNLLAFIKPAEYAETIGSDRPFQHSILAMNFSQSDLINTDYAQLVHCQLYKAILLLDFLEDNPKYHPLLGTFLQAFGSHTKQEFMTSIAHLIMLPFKGNNKGVTTIVLPRDQNFKKNISFFEQLIIADETVFENDDYIKLRNAPLQRMSETEYRVIYELFLVKKVYNGLYFKLRDLLSANPSLFQESLAGAFKMEFSEGILVYSILSKIFSSKDSIAISGSDFKKAGIKKSEPDFYARNGSGIFLFESKDVFIRGDIKSSYDFPIIEEELEKRLYKEELENGKNKDGAVRQLVNNVSRILKKELKVDVDYSAAECTIYPCIILHDSIFSAPGLNYLVNDWFTIELNHLFAGADFQAFDIKRVMPLTIIEIDTLILLSEIFKEKQGALEQLLIDYHRHVKYNYNGGFSSAQDAEDYLKISTLPFAEFARSRYNGKELDSAIQQMIGMFKAYGVK